MFIYKALQSYGHSVRITLFFIYLDYMSKDRPFSLQILCTHRSHRTCKKKNNQVCFGYNYYCMDIIHRYLQSTADGLEQLAISGKLDDW